MGIEEIIDRLYELPPEEFTGSATGQSASCEQRVNVTRQIR